MNAKSEREERTQTQIEAAACAVIQLLADRTLMDTEWALMRTKLLEFAGILRGWDRSTTTSRRGNVEVLCRREP
jgi:hypothetical protein